MRRLIGAAGVLCLCVAVVAAGADAPLGSAEPAASPSASSSPAPTTTPVPAPQRLEEAEVALLTGELDAAEQAFAELASDAELGLAAQLGLVRCQLLDGRDEEAAETLAACAEAGKESAAWHRMQSRIARLHGDYDLALEAARKATRINANDCQARLQVADLLEYLGRRKEAIQAYRWFDDLVHRVLPDNAADLTAAGKGFYRYSVLTESENLPDRTRHVLNQMLQTACVVLDANYWPARLAVADLLREKHNAEEAEGDYEKVLEQNEYVADAHLGLGWIAFDKWDFDEIDERVEAALDINPRCGGAYCLQAARQILENRCDEAVASAERALEVNPNDLEALAYAQAARTLQNDSTAAAAYAKRIQEIAPGSPTPHRVLGAMMFVQHRFGDGIEHYRQALEDDPSDANVLAEMGMAYMLDGLEDEAGDVLDRAWQLDRFNEMTRNTRELLERLESFHTFESERFIVRVDAEQDYLLGPLALEHLESMRDELCTRYGVDLGRRPIIEFFPSSREFSIRVSGQPFIQTVGACTGWLIALSTPRNGENAGGSFNYVDVLRHEFTHTVTLIATDFRIPRWFTEGLAVREEGRPRAFEWTRLLVDATHEDRLFSLDEIDWRFVRPKRGGDRQQAYAQSEWMLEFIVEQHGEDAIRRLLTCIGDAQTQEQAFSEVLGQSCATFDEAFAKWAAEQVEAWGFKAPPAVEEPEPLEARLAENPDDVELAARLAWACLNDENNEKAESVAQEVLGRDAENARALEVLLRVTLHKQAESNKYDEARALGEEALKVAERLAKADETNWFALRTAAQMRLIRDQEAAARPWLEKLHAAWPRDEFAAGALGKQFYEEGRLEEAQECLEYAAEAAPHDVVLALLLGEIAARRGDLESARQWCLKARDAGPFYPPVYERLAELAMRRGDTAGAVKSYKTLCQLAPSDAGHHADCAFALSKLGKTEEAQRYARTAVTLDPQSPASALLPSGS